MASGRRSNSLEGPLSQEQLRLWTLSQVEGPNAAYHIALRIELWGDVDVSRVTAALVELGHRHESLRTSFVSSGAAPHRLVHASADPEILRADDGAPLLPACSTLIERPFDHSRRSLYRFAIAAPGPGRCEAVLCLHHLVADGWTARLLFSDLLRLLRRQAGEPMLLPDPTAYGRYVAHQETLAGRAATDLDYWAAELDGLVPGAPGLGNAGEAEAEAIEYPLAPSLRKRIRDAARSHRLTVAACHLAAFAAVTARQTGSEDMVVAVPVSTRRGRLFDDMAGFCVNTVPVRLRPDPLKPAAVFAREAMRSLVAANERCHAPYDALLRRLGHSPDRGQLASASFGMSVLPVEDRSGSRVHGRMRDLPVPGAAFPADLIVYENGSVGSGLLAVQPRFLERRRAERITRQMRLWLGGFCRDPDRELRALPILTAGERRSTVVAPNRSSQPYPRDLTIPALVARHSSAGTTALIASTGSLSYLELDRAVCALAARIVATLGEVAGRRIAVLTGRTAAMPIAALAAMRVGGIYLPLDPLQPPPRLRLIVADSGAALVVATPSNLDLAARLGASVLEIDEGGGTAAGAVPDAALPLMPTDAGGEAFLLYTSGSTGSPKGVRCHHRGLVRLAWAETSADEPLPILLALARPSFDLSVREILGTLVVGGTVVLPGEDAPSIEAAVDAVIEHRVNRLDLSPRPFHDLLHALPPNLPSLLDVKVGGDVNSLADFEEFRRRFPSCRLSADYGPTENGVKSTRWTLGSTEGRSSVPIGLPVPNSTAYVLDAFLGPLPQGAVGEIYVGGEGVALGYLDRPDLTAERFVPDPFRPGEPEARLYRTGDLGRWNEEGLLEFVGRADRQVKIAGFRVEPAEIESVLGRIPGILECAVVADFEGRSGPRLLAAIVVSENAEPTLEKIRAHSELHLPFYMVPDEFVLMPHLPATAHGKIDGDEVRRAAAEASSRLGGAPMSRIEEAVAACFSSILGVQEVDLETHFFAAGGHSLLAVQAVARLRALFGLDLPNRLLFERPTVRATAAEIARRSASAGTRIEPPTLPLAAGTAPATLQQRAILHASRGSAHRQSPFLLQLPILISGLADEGALEAAVADLALMHRALSARLVCEGDTIRQVHVSSRAPLYGVVDVSDLPAGDRLEAARFLVREAAAAPLDPEVEACRWLMIRCGDRSRMLAGSFHHAFVDGESLAILFAHLVDQYAARAESKGSGPAAVRPDMLDYGAWEHRQLSNEPPAPDPGPRSRSSLPGGRRYRSHVIPGGWAALRQTAATAGVSTLALSIACLALERRPGGDQASEVATSLSTRFCAELWDAVGCFAAGARVRVEAHSDLFAACESAQAAILAAAQQAAFGTFAASTGSPAGLPFIAVAADAALPRDACGISFEPQSPADGWAPPPAWLSAHPTSFILEQIGDSLLVNVLHVGPPSSAGTGLEERLVERLRGLADGAPLGPRPDLPPARS